MEQPVVNFILGRLSVLSDDELANLDFESASTAMDDGLSDSEKQQLKRIFTSIQSELGIRHYGVKGMRWGIRRYQNKDGSLTEAGKRRAADANAKSSIFGTAQPYSIKTRSGENISVQPLKPPSTARKIWDALMGTSNTEMGTRGDANYTLSDSSGNKIGQLSLISKSANVAYIDWITIDEKHRGKGYATDVMNDLIGKARESGYSRIELNALKKPRPLYERLGFTYRDRSNDSIVARISEFELGTKRMEYDLRKEITHMDSTVYTVDGMEFSLQHYGVKGMKWGVRKARQEYAELDRRKAAYKKAKGDYKSAYKKAYNRSAGALSPFKKHRRNAEKRWETAAKKAEKLDAAKKAYKEQKKSVRKNTTIGQKMGRGSKAVAKALGKVDQAYVTDQLFYGGMGTKAVKSAVTLVGMTTITAATMARGGYDIKWYNKQGQRVG